MDTPETQTPDEEEDALIDALDRVNSRETFLDFVRALIEDRRDEVRKERANPSSPWGPGANGWENHTIDGFLEAAVAWAEATSPDTHAPKLPQEPSWQEFADFLYCGKVYE